MWNLFQCWCHPQPINVVTSPQYHDPDAAVELNGRVNEADIFVGDIQVTSLIDTRTQVSTITQDFCEEHGYEIHPVKMLQLKGKGVHHSIPGVYRNYC